jgi:putative heme-binding domain-containing protein
MKRQSFSAKVHVPTVLLAFLLAAGVSMSFAADATRLALQPEDHICLVGGSLPERMQHDGWLETLLQSRFPQLKLRFRNLAFAADELTVRNRSEGFGSPDEHLALQQTDVVFAFWGFNESFAGEAGLDKFRQDLEAFVKHTLSQQYNGSGPPRLVLFSPIAHEDLRTPNLPDGSANNARLGLYTRAMAEVAAANHVPFVDLFTASQQLYGQAKSPLTINGIHLTEEGNRQIAHVIDEALFGRRDGAVADESLERLRQAVLDKDFYWFHRYRTTDGYSSYGGRSYLKFVDDQTNREVMLRELEVLDDRANARDRRVWSVAAGGDSPVDDSGAPPFIPVKTNKPGAGPGGTHLFLGGEAAIEQMTLAPGMKVNLYASEEMFPELVNPVQMAWDTRGRLWVAAWPTYPHWKPDEEMNDKLLVLEDTDGDGRADRCHAWADGLHNPTGFEFWGGGVLVAMAPDLLFLKDTDGDDKADVRIRVLHGIDSADTHHTANSFTLDPGGALYFQEGVFHRTQSETPYGPERNYDACVWRFEPRTWKLSRYIAYGFANPHGHAFDRWGQDIVHDGTGANPFHAALFSGFLPHPERHNNPPQVYQQRTRPCPGTEYVSSRHFPDEMQGNLLVGNVIGFLGILRYRIDDDGASFAGTEQQPILSSTDPNFRPTDFEFGPDGALYFVDWQNPIIGHMQHNLRDPSRDKTHGRVYRITCPDRPLLIPPPIADQPIDALLALLKEPEDRVRYRARIELSGRPTDEVIAATRRWLAGLNPQDADYQHQVLEGLWVHQHHNVVDADLLGRVLRSPDFRARAAATRVLCYWHDRVPNSLELLKQLAADEHPRVRLEAVRAASFFSVPEAVEVPVLAAEYPRDKYLDFTLGETHRALDPIWKQALAAGRDVAVTSEPGERFILRNMALDQLLARKRSPAAYQELLFRPGVLDEIRREALATLARQQNSTQVKVLLDALRTIDARNDARDENVVFDLVRLLTSRGALELTGVRPDIERLALEARQPVIRQASFVAVVNIDGGPDRAWQLGTVSVPALRDLVNAVPLIADPSLQAAFYPLIQPLLTGLPETLSSAGADVGANARFVRIELPRPGTLTLAEVEVYSEDRNVARAGTATQKNTAHGGEAARGIDGNTDASYGGGGQTHTEENTDQPWWEVDLGEERPIDRIVVFNRGDADLGQRLNGFTLIALDAQRNEVFRQQDIPAPAPSAQFELAGGGPAALVRRAAMNALTYIRGQETPTFQALAAFVHDDVDRLAAVRAMQRIPKRFWAQDLARPTIDVLLSQVRNTPVADRTAPATLDVLEFADGLTTLLPPEDARAIRGELRALGVRVVRIGTLPERMSYDQDIIVLAAGKPVEILLENPDLMPHNLVIAQPGSLEEIGLLAESTAQGPGAVERQYVPPSDKIILASRLLQGRQSQRLSFTAPDRPGVYPFVCTFPGHWRRMHGALYVVEDLDAYLAAPEEYLAAHPLPIEDKLLADRRPRTQWKLEDLADAVEGLKEGRSLGNATQMFQVASCVACHRLNGTGNQIGPDLAKLDEKWKAGDILREVLDPSAKINEKFQTWIFQTTDGRVITGLILEEDANQVKIIENPLAKVEPVVLKTSEIDERQKSPQSIMPKGLLDKLTRDEILDLIAYISARGNRASPFFQGGGHDHAAKP